ncbi:MAG: cation-translocating P-type ATPase, partial [Chloroflexota bacterium]|nr:cation-translocating P-type ATPase [Chloroflexota bacterium]
MSAACDCGPGECAPEREPTAKGPAAAQRDVGQIIGWGVLSIVALVVILAALGERLGIFEQALEQLPWWIPALAIVIGGWPIFKGVARSVWRRHITSQTLMSVGVVAAAAIGQWTTAALIVFFMRFAEWMEQLTTARAREAVRQLTELAPTTALVLRDGQEVEVSVEAVQPGDVVLVRPGARVPVDGEVIEGNAAVDEASITGESVPKDKAVGDRVFAATFAQAGFLKVRALRVGNDTTFGRIVRLVEEAEGQKAPIQKFADKFAGYYLPVVLVVAALTLLLTRQLLNAVAVVVVACACAIVIATPVVVLASVGSAARRGLLVKGGIVLEQLARIDTIVIDKTGTLTHGRPQMTDVVPLNGLAEPQLLEGVAGAERRSEHPLARAIVAAAAERGLPALEPESFVSLPGRGVQAELSGRRWTVGNRALLAALGVALDAAAETAAGTLEQQGKTAFFAAVDGAVAGLVAVADTVRPDVEAALEELRRLGITRFLLLTGDNERVAAAISTPLGLEYRAGLLPEDKIAAIQELQAAGHTVLMVGDGVNDAPALAQADVGVAMGVAGSDVAIEAADVALMREDWLLVPEAILLGRRAARTIRQNLWFTGAYNIAGIALAAIGLLPPVWAA